MQAHHVAESGSKRRATTALARKAGPSSPIDLAPFAGLYTYRRGHSVHEPRSAGLPPSKSCSQTLKIQTIGTLQQTSGARACLAEAPFLIAVHEGIKADVRFVALESKPTRQSSDRGRTGHYRRRAGLDSAHKTYSR